MAAGTIIIEGYLPMPRRDRTSATAGLPTDSVNATPDRSTRGAERADRVIE